MNRSRTSYSRFERRLSRTASIIVGCFAALYLYCFLTSYENNIFIFLANVFAPALLVLTLGATVVAELFNLFRGTRPHLKDRVLRGTLVLTFLVPTIVGELRSHPHRELSGPASNTGISVLNANLLGPLDVDSRFYEEVSRRSPDIIILQELNPTVAERLSNQLGASYPCKALEPKPGVLGMGVFSKFPCTKRDSSTFRPGIGVPQIVDVQLPNQKTVGVINVHTIPPHILTKYNRDDNEIQQLSNSVIERELFVEEIIKASRAVNTDVAIIAGDFNATTRNRAYQLVRQMGYFDAFAVGSRLLGGTWPGPQFPLPSWLVRIDFIFHCAGLQAVEAETLPDGYGSDHRGVFARLGFVS